MPTFRRGDFICHSNAPPPKLYIYNAPMITLQQSKAGPHYVIVAPRCNSIPFKNKSKIEINSILIGHGYMLTGTDGGKDFYSKIR